MDEVLVTSSRGILGPCVSTWCFFLSASIFFQLFSMSRGRLQQQAAARRKTQRPAFLFRGSAFLVRPLWALPHENFSQPHTKLNGPEWHKFLQFVRDFTETPEKFHTFIPQFKINPWFVLQLPTSFATNHLIQKKSKSCKSSLNNFIWRPLTPQTQCRKC